jgi:hypothetical protein
VIKLDSDANAVSKYLKIVSINAQSLADVDHMRLLRLKFAQKCVDVIAVTETWLKEKHKNHKIHEIDGYKLIRHDRLEMRGGGVAFYIKNSLAFNILSCSRRSNDASNCEYLIVDIKLNGQKVMFCVLYRRPIYNINFDEFFNDFANLYHQYEQCIVLGDLNCNFKAESNLLQNLKSHMDDFALKRLPIDDTHLSYNALTTIDVIIVSPDWEPVSYGKLHNNLSHHDILFVIFEIDMPESVDEFFLVRDFEKIDRNILCANALQIDWTETDVELPLNDRVLSFNSKLIKLFDVIAPVRKIKKKEQFKPRLPVDLKKKVNERDSAKKFANRSCSWDAFNIYKMLRNRVKQLILNFQRSVIYDSLCRVANTTQIWSKLRSLGLIKDKSRIAVYPIPINELAEGLTIKRTPEELAKIDLNCSIPRDLSGEKFYFRYVPPVEVKYVVKSIKSPAEGVDKICNKMLKLPVDFILPALTFIINSALQTSSFPAAWKNAILKPIPKVNVPKEAKDYRPISILCVLSKVLEKVVYNQLTEYLANRGVFESFQSGFRKMHSTTTALLKITEDIRVSMFKGDVTLMVFLDFSKAFDMVDHALLLKKLRELNMSEPVIKFFESYLAGRSHAIKDSLGQYSNWIKIEAGVPQGSVLGPLLFSLFSLDVAELFKGRCKYHIYADDIQLYLTCKPHEINTAVGIMNEILRDVLIWSNKHGLRLNANKTQVLIVSRERQYSKIDFSSIDKISVNDTLIPYSEVVENLGIFFDKHLSWNKQISYVHQKVYGVLKNLEKFRNVTPEYIRIRLVKSLIIPLFDYCDIVYCNITAAQIEKLQVLQNNVIRYIYDVKRGDALSPLYKRCEILKIVDRRNLHILMQTHKILYQNCPDYLSDFATTMYDVNLARRTRAHKMTLLAPFVSVEVPENCFKVLCYRLWNGLKSNLCLNANINSVKKAMTEHYLSKY